MQRLLAGRGRARSPWGGTSPAASRRGPTPLSGPARGETGRRANLADRPRETGSMPAQSPLGSSPGTPWREADRSTARTLKRRQALEHAPWAGLVDRCPQRRRLRPNRGCGRSRARSRRRASRVEPARSASHVRRSSGDYRTSAERIKRPTAAQLGAQTCSRRIPRAESAGSPAVGPC